jgi:signal transduction histidine kinase
LKKVIGLILIGMFLLTGGMAWAQERASAAEAKLWVDKAEKFYKENGKEKSIAEFNKSKGQFVKGELYIYIWDLQGTVLAHPTNPATIGKNNRNVPDEDGKFFRKEAVDLANAKGSGWIDYKYKNPKTNKVEQKTTYVKKVDDLIICSGAYK